MRVRRRGVNRPGHNELPRQGFQQRSVPDVYAAGVAARQEEARARRVSRSRDTANVWAGAARAAAAEALPPPSMQEELEWIEMEVDP